MGCGSPFINEKYSIKIVQPHHKAKSADLNHWISRSITGEI